MNRPFTGRDAALVIGGGFLVVIAVNLAMAVLATRSFTGLVVPNGYVASQDFNRWLAAGRAQAELGWTPRAEISGDRLLLTVEGPGTAPVTGLVAHARFLRPVAAGAALELKLVEGPAGLYAAPLDLPPGAYDLQLALTDARGHRHLSTRRIAILP